MMGQRRLRLAARRRLESTRNDAETPDDHPDSKSTSPDWLQRSAAWFESVAARMLEPVEIPAQIKGGLAIASPHRRLPELIAGSLLLASAAGFVVASLTGRMFPGAVVGAVVLATPSTVLMIRVRQRRRVFAEGLPDVLHLLAGATRSGLPLSRAIGVLAMEMDGPAENEFSRAAAEVALGQPLERALAGIGERMRCDEVAWVGVAVEIHRQSGGNLAEVLDAVGDAAMLRQRLRREIASLTAEGRISAVVLGLLPPGLAGVLLVVNPGYLASLTGSSEGRAMLFGAFAAMLVGFVWMHRIVSVEI